VVVVLVVAVVDTLEAEVEVYGPAGATSAVDQDSILVDQDSVVVRSMEEWAISSNVTMQIGIATGTGGMSISSAIGSLFLTTASGLGLILRIITIRTTTRIITDTISPPTHIRCRRSVSSNRTWPGKVTIAAQSTGFTARRRAWPSRVIKASTGCK
jgi:hypothetical protein